MSQEAAGRWDRVSVFTVACVVRAVFCFALYPLVADQFGPGDGYDTIALSVANGGGYQLDGVPAAAERLPLYPLFLAGSFRLFGPGAWPWQLAQCACGAFTCVLVLAMARRHASRVGALCAASVCVLHPTLILYTARPLTETLYILLLVLFVWALSDPPRPVRAGALLGLLWLIKTTAALNLLALVPLARRRQFASVGTALLSAALVLLPWFAWNMVTTGQPHLFTATSGRALYHGLYISQHVSWTTPTGDLNRDAELALWRDLAARGVARDADVALRDAVAGQVARQWMSAHPGEALRLLARNLVLTWYLGRSRLSMLVHALLHGAVLVAATLGARRLWRAPPARDLVMVTVLLIATYTVFHAVVQPAVRYILPAVPLAAILAAAGFGRRGFAQ